MRTVKVHEVPDKVKISDERIFLHKLRVNLDAERPRFVLDCSKVECMSVATIRLLLSCLELAMKRNGDVRLASLSPNGEASLRLTGVDRLFEIYASADEAVQSFHHRPASMVPQPVPTGKPDGDSEYAA